MEDIEDLFEFPEKLPDEVRDVLWFNEINGYEDCESMLKDLKPLGYTFDYGLDFVPYNLRKIDLNPEFFNYTQNQQRCWF